MHRSRYARRRSRSTTACRWTSLPATASRSRPTTSWSVPTIARKACAPSTRSASHAFRASSLIPPFRADHIGSLLRPKKLREAFRNLSGAELRAVQDECIREVVRLQKDCGLEVVTDGEFRRISCWEKFVRLTAGLEVRDAVFTFHDAAGQESKFTAPYVSGRVERREPIKIGRASSRERV